VRINTPPSPEFGHPLPQAASQSVIDAMARRRSTSAASLTRPAPSGLELADLLRLAARVPDHGKLAPWRFVVLQGPEKGDFVSRLEAIAAANAQAGKLTAKLGKLKAPPLAVVVVSSPRSGDIPVWEQTLSAGAVCYALLLAANAMGFGANWITDWYSYDPSAQTLLGLGPDETVAGFVLIGTTSEPPSERARPDVAQLTTHWKPPG
jgi:nitroreductase